MLNQILQTIDSVLSESTVTSSGNLVFSNGKKIWASNGNIYIQADIEFPKGCFYTPILSHAIKALGDQYKMRDEETFVYLSNKNNRFKIAKVNTEPVEMLKFDPNGELEEFDLANFKLVFEGSVKSRLAQLGAVFFDSTNFFASDNSKLIVHRHNLTVPNKFQILVDVADKLIKFQPKSISVSDKLYAENHIPSMQLILAPVFNEEQIPYECFLDGQPKFSLEIPELNQFIEDMKTVVLGTIDEKIIHLSITEKGIKLKGSSSYGELESFLPTKSSVNLSFRILLKHLDEISGSTAEFVDLSDKTFLRTKTDQTTKVILINTINE
jgi:hypothetical protein